MNPFAQHLKAHELAALQWLAPWATQRTLREVRNVLVVVYSLQGRSVHADGVVEHLMQNGTWSEIQGRMTDAIAWVCVAGLTEQQVYELMTPHEELVDRDAHK